MPPYYTRAESPKIPRNYVSELEIQVKKLTQEIQELQSQSHMSPKNATTSLGTWSPPRHELTTGRPPTSDGSSSHYQDLVQSVKNVAVEPSRQPRFLGQGSGITLAWLVMTAIKVDALPSALFAEQPSYDPSLTSIAAEASLPPRHVADHLVEVYFQYRTPHLPIVERWQVELALDNAYFSASERQSSDRTVEKDIFTAYMIFAIALCDVPNPSGGRPTQSEGCFRSAISQFEKFITYSMSDLETLRAVLLLTQFVALCPSRGSLWHLAGIALRLCIDMGLHWETEEQCIDMDPDLLNEHRRLWYSTYQFDRILCVTLGRPLGIIDESTHVQLPNLWAMCRQSEPNKFDIHNHQAHNHLFNMSKLESEIKHVQHSQSWTQTIAYPRPDYSAWLQDIQPRLKEWYSTIPHPSQAHSSSIFAYQAYWDSIYYNSILLLHRPNSTTLHPSTQALIVSFDASCKLIASMKILQREGKLDILWKAVHHLFIAGLGVIYGLWYSKEIRDQIPVRNSISTLQSCATTLSALSENFPGAASCRDSFESLSSATVDWLVTNDAQELLQNRLEFEKQVQDLLQQLQPSRGGMEITAESSRNNMSTMLSSDNFALSEMLSSAAQWPDLQDMDMFQ
jgi:Fungal specific transcription factor domain